MSNIEKYKNVNELRKSGFYDLSEPDQMKFLKENGFYEMSNQDKIDFLERAGLFYLDINDDPPSPPLEPNNIDYTKSKKINRIKSFVATKIGEKFAKKVIKKKALIVKEYVGLENMENLNSGAIITCNHFNPFDSFSVELAFRVCGQVKKRKMFVVIREGNYTNFPGFYGFLFRNCDTLPLSSITKTMAKFLKAIDTILRRGDYVLIFPEQSMWWDYKQPKPPKDGAFKFAVKSNVPVLPSFITMKDSDVIGEDGKPVQEYTVHFGKPIYPDHMLTPKENMEAMRQANYKFCKETYEKVYGKPVQYKTELHKDIPEYVSSIEGFKDTIIKE